MIGAMERHLSPHIHPTAAKPLPTENSSSETCMAHQSPIMGPGPPVTGDAGRPGFLWGSSTGCACTPVLAHACPGWRSHEGNCLTHLYDLFDGGVGESSSVEVLAFSINSVRSRCISSGSLVSPAETSYVLPSRSNLSVTVATFFFDANHVRTATPTEEAAIRPERMLPTSAINAPITAPTPPPGRY